MVGQRVGELAGWMVVMTVALTAAQRVCSMVALTAVLKVDLMDLQKVEYLVEY